MGKATDNLIALAAQVSTTRPGREMDMLLTTGERVSAALLTMALADLGVPAVSFTGSQVGIITDTTHGKAKILEVKGDRVRDGARRRQGRRGRRLPGREHRPRDHHDGPRRQRPHGLGPGEGPRRRCLRDLHRRHRRVLGRPAHRAPGPQARPHQLRRDARDGRRRIEGARPAIGGVRPQPRRRPPRPLGVHVGTRHVGAPTNPTTRRQRSKGQCHGRSDHLRCRHRRPASRRSP